MQELPNPILPIRYIPLPIQDNIDYSFQVFESLPYVTQKFLCDLLPLFIAILENSSRTGHTSQTIAMCMGPSFIGRYSNRKDSVAVAIRYTRNLIEFWSEIEDRLAEYSDSDSSCSDGEPINPSRIAVRRKSYDEHNRTRSPFRAHAAHTVRAVNSHQDVSNSIDTFSDVSGAVRSVSTTTAPRSSSLRREFGETVNVFSDTKTLDLSRTYSSGSNSASSIISHHIGSNSADNSICNHKSQSFESLPSPYAVSAPSLVPPPPPPKLRKSASTILRPTTSNPSSNLSRPKLNTRCSFSGDLNSNSSVLNGRMSKTVPTKRGRMVAELAKLYEEKNSPPVLIEMNKSKSNIQLS